jgi:hypothetical protein
MLALAPGRNANSAGERHAEKSAGQRWSLLRSALRCHVKAAGRQRSATTRQ